MYSFRLVTFSACIMPSVRISRCVKRTQKMVHKYRIEFSFKQKSQKYYGISGLLQFSFSLYLSLSLRHPFSLWGMKFEWDSEWRRRRWGDIACYMHWCVWQRGNSCRQRISVIEYDKFCSSLIFLFFPFWQNCKIRLSKGLYVQEVDAERVAKKGEYQISFENVYENGIWQRVTRHKEVHKRYEYIYIYMYKLF